MWNCALQAWHLLPQKHYPQDQPPFLPQPQGQRRTDSISCQHAIALSHPTDRTISECKGGLCLRRFLGDASNSKSPEIRQEQKLAFPTRQLCYTLMEDSCVSPSPPKMHLVCFDTSTLGVSLQGDTHAPLWPQPCLTTVLIEYVCMCMCECARVYVCMCECARVCVSRWEHVWVHVCVFHLPDFERVS